VVIEVIEEAKKSGIELYLKDGELYCRGGRGRIGPGLKERIRIYKKEILAYLNDQTARKEEKKAIEPAHDQERIERRLIKFNKFIAQRYPRGYLLEAGQEFTQKLNEYENELHQAYQEVDLEKVTAILLALQKHYERGFKQRG